MSGTTWKRNGSALTVRKGVILRVLYYFSHADSLFDAGVTLESHQAGTRAQESRFNAVIHTAGQKRQIGTRFALNPMNIEGCARRR